MAADEVIGAGLRLSGVQQVTVDELEPAADLGGFLRCCSAGLCEELLREVQADDLVALPGEHYALGSLPAAGVEDPERSRKLRKMSGQLAPDEFLANRVADQAQPRQPGIGTRIEPLAGAHGGRP